jgi:DNA-binding NarL/FixJ family response regulator
LIQVNSARAAALEIDLMASSDQIRILIVDDHPIFQEGLARVIRSQADLTVVAQANNCQQAISDFRQYQPDITLMDQRLNGSSGIDVLIAIRKEFPRARVIMLTAYDGDLIIRRALQAGAASYVLKSAAKNELVAVIRSVHSGQSRLPAEVATRLTEYFTVDHLTPRELDVLRLIRDGNGNKQIAGALSIAETTVNFHVKNLVAKLRANDRIHAVALAIKRGILEV